MDGKGIKLDKEHEEIRLNGITEDSLEEWLRQKVVEHRMAKEAVSKMKFVSLREECRVTKIQHKNVFLNVLQLLILISAVAVEVFAVRGVIPQEFAVIILAVLTVSCFVIVKKINKKMAG